MATYALILDDHPLVARGIAEYLRARFPQMEVALTTRVDDALTLLAERGAPAIALVDFWLADGAALQMIAQLRSRYPSTAVAVVSGDDDPAVVQHAREAGAQGFIHKQDAPEAFAQAVHALLAGLAWFPSRAEIDLASLSPRNRDLPVTPAELGLSTRQGEVLALVLQGLPNKRIAQQYGLSESTVKEHMSAILQRLGVRTRVEAITQLRGRQLVLPPHETT